FAARPRGAQITSAPPRATPSARSHLQLRSSQLRAVLPVSSSETRANSATKVSPLSSQNRARQRRKATLGSGAPRRAGASQYGNKRWKHRNHQPPPARTSSSQRGTLSQQRPQSQTEPGGRHAASGPAASGQTASANNP